MLKRGLRKNSVLADHRFLIEESFYSEKVIPLFTKMLTGSDYEYKL